MIDSKQTVLGLREFKLNEVLNRCEEGRAAKSDHGEAKPVGATAVVTSAKIFPLSFPSAALKGYTVGASIFKTFGLDIRHSFDP